MRYACCALLRSDGLIRRVMQEGVRCAGLRVLKSHYRSAHSNTPRQHALRPAGNITHIYLPMNICPSRVTQKISPLFFQRRAGYRQYRVMMVALYEPRDSSRVFTIVAVDAFDARQRFVGRRKSCRRVMPLSLSRAPQIA